MQQVQKALIVLALSLVITVSFSIGAYANAYPDEKRQAAIKTSKKATRFEPVDESLMKSLQSVRELLSIVNESV